MKQLIPLLLLLASCGTTRVMSQAGAAEFEDSINPVADHTTAGIEVSSGPKGGGLGFELGFRFSKGSGSENGISNEAETGSYYGGARYEWRASDFSPFISVGASTLRVRSTNSAGSSDHASDLGLYLGAGADYHFGSGWHLGASLRRTIDQDVSATGFDGPGDAWVYLLRFGYAF
jgi:hypothetical protein